MAFTVLLIRPNPGKSIYASIPPLGIGYLATNLRKAGIEPEIWDLALGGKVIKEFKKRVGQKLDADLVGLQTYSRDVAQTKAFMDWLSPRLSPKTTVVLGGPHASVATEHALTYLDRANFAFFGEALSEMKKVVWLTRQEAVYLTTLVLVVAIAAGIVLGVIDFGFAELVNRVFLGR